MEHELRSIRDNGCRERTCYRRIRQTAATNAAMLYREYKCEESPEITRRMLITYPDE